MGVDFNESFNRYFEMVPAVSEALKNEVYRLRYQVYCAETAFLDCKRYHDGLEYDAYDDTAIHYLVRHRKSGIYAATTRLIVFNGDAQDRLFPLEVHSRIDNPDLLQRLPRAKLAEVSRFCVSKEFKKRQAEFGTLTGVGINVEQAYTENERRSFPHITLALIAALIKISDDRDIHYWYAVMEPALLRFLSTLGIYFTAIGPLTDYHGIRRPCVIKVNDLLDGVAKKNPGLWDMMTDNGSLWTNHKQY